MLNMVWHVYYTPFYPCRLHSVHHDKCGAEQMCVIYVPDTLHRNAIRRDETELNVEKRKENKVATKTHTRSHAHVKSQTRFIC